MANNGLINEKSEPMAGNGDMPEQAIFPTPSRTRLAFRALSILAAVVLAAKFIVPETGRISNLPLHALTEIGIGLLGLLTGFSIVLRFHTMGRRFHLFLGLAFFINGVADLIHGALCLTPGIFDLAGDLTPRLFIMQSYRASQLMMGMTLGAAMVVPSLLGRQKSPLRETLTVSLIVLFLTAFSSTIQSLGGVMSADAKRAGITGTSGAQSGVDLILPFQNTDLIAATILMIVGLAFLWRYFRQADLLMLWIALSALTNFLSQISMIRNSEPFDAAFCLAHLYKFLGYLLPLFGFVIYQITAIVQLERTQKQLIAAREQALQATRAKSEFLANISHEIRTPMNAILGMTRQVLRTTLAESQRERLEDVQNSGKALLTLLNEILDYSKLEAGKAILDISVFRLRDCVEDAIKALSVTAHDKQLQLELEIPESSPDRLIGDAGRLRQILVNLISNAIKFTDEGGVYIKIQPLQQFTDSVEFEFQVRDTGIGIPKEKQQAIFEAFVQADGSTTRQFGGTGLGLAIAKTLIELMKGRLWVESQVGQGSTFHFTATFRIATEEFDDSKSTEYELHLPKTSIPRRILLAEDNLINQRLAQGLLREMGHSSLVANNGQEAIELLDDNEVHLILMDLQMPLLGGMEATSVIRQRERRTGRHVPIIALTADIVPIGRDQCLAVGMDEYLTKPLDERELFAMIERFALRPTSPLPVSEAVDSISSNEDSKPADLSPTPSPHNVVRKVLNRDRLVSQVGGDFDLLCELISLFEAQSSELLSSMRESLRTFHMENLATHAHKLAGSLASLQAEAALDACRKLEDRSLSKEDCHAAFAVLEVKLAQLRPLLLELVESKTKSPH